MAKICDAIRLTHVVEPSSAECIDCKQKWAKGVMVLDDVISHVEQTSHSVIVDTNHRELWGMA